MNPVLILCLIMSLIFLAMPFIMFIFALIKGQKAIGKAALIWLIVNVILVLLLWVLYFACLRTLGA